MTDQPKTATREDLLEELERLREENRALQESRDDSQRKEQRYRLITENTLDLICEVSQHGFYTYVSPNHQDLLGYRPKDLLGHNFATLIHQDEVSAVVEQFSECIVASIPFVTTFRLRHRDGSWHWVEVSAKPLDAVTAPGATPYEGQAIFVYRDVTERRETRQRPRHGNRAAGGHARVHRRRRDFHRSGRQGRAGQRRRPGAVGRQTRRAPGPDVGGTHGFSGRTGPQADAQPHRLRAGRWHDLPPAALRTGRAAHGGRAGILRRGRGHAGPRPGGERARRGPHFPQHHRTQTHRAGTPQAQQTGIARPTRRTHRARFQ